MLKEQKFAIVANNGLWQNRTVLRKKKKNRTRQNNGHHWHKMFRLPWQKKKKKKKSCIWFIACSLLESICKFNMLYCVHVKMSAALTSNFNQLSWWLIPPKRFRLPVARCEKSVTRQDITKPPSLDIVNFFFDVCFLFFSFILNRDWPARFHERNNVKQNRLSASPRNQ